MPVVPRIAVLHHGSAESPAVLRLRQVLHQQGVVHGSTCVIDTAGADRHLERIPRLAEELLSRSPTVLVAIGAVAALAAQTATHSTPVLHATVLEPRDIGLTGKNLAGVTTFHPDHAMGRLRLLEEIVPRLHTVACLYDPEAPRGPDGSSPLVASLRIAAQCEEIGLRWIALHGIDTGVDSAIDEARRAGVAALIALEVPSVLARLREIARAARRCALPTLLPTGYGVRGTAMLGPGLPDAADALADHIIAILRGVPVAHLPVRRVHHERRFVDVRMARRLGLTVPSSTTGSAACRHGDRPASTGEVGARSSDKRVTA